MFDLNDYDNLTVTIESLTFATHDPHPSNAQIQAKIVVDGPWEALKKLPYAERRTHYAEAAVEAYEAAIREVEASYPANEVTGRVSALPKPTQAWGLPEWKDSRIALSLHNNLEDGPSVKFEIEGKAVKLRLCVNEDATICLRGTLVGALTDLERENASHSVFKFLSGVVATPLKPSTLRAPTLEDHKALQRAAKAQQKADNS